ncbi:hypothetical protein [Methylobacter sp. YRD-M1]|uniref:hypothetical protein n=1 Tax=Methylobacter sp. YRD-M1 TaxID=2911520 RepID=UPI00227B9356|nr:hypothetical protein [Methylobacter sp. YRD-M1]WAK01506.1 hypothetical protein LZ558_17005 [Methylobacter sp. YRD-M1]
MLMLIVAQKYYKLPDLSKRDSMTASKTTGGMGSIFEVFFVILLFQNNPAIVRNAFLSNYRFLVATPFTCLQESHVLFKITKLSRDI